MTEVDKAYLAGIIDGEGWIRLHKHTKKGVNYYHPEIGIGNTEIGWLESLRATWSSVGHIYYIQPKRSQWQPSANWMITGKQALFVLSEILPYMRMKTGLAEVVLAFRHVEKGKLRSEEEKAKIGELYTQTKKLIKRNTHVLDRVPLVAVTH